MKKSIVVAFIAGITFACSRKSTPTSDIIISNHENKVVKKEALPANTNVPEANNGQTVFTTRCGRCHGLKTVENYTAQQWEAILKIMTVKASLNEIETKQVTAYVMEHAKK